MLIQLCREGFVKQRLFWKNIFTGQCDAAVARQFLRPVHMTHGKIHAGTPPGLSKAVFTCVEFMAEVSGLIGFSLGVGVVYSTI